MTHINEFLEGRVCTFFLFKFIFTKQLMSTVCHKWLEMRSTLYEEITNSRNDWLLFLTFRQSFR